MTDLGAELCDALADIEHRGDTVLGIQLRAALWTQVPKSARERDGDIRKVWGYPVELVEELEEPFVIGWEDPEEGEDECPTCGRPLDGQEHFQRRS